MISFKELDKITTQLANEGSNSFPSLDKLAEEDKINCLIEDGLLPDLIKGDITTILNILYERYPYHYKKKMILHYLCNDISYNGNYLLALYAGSSDAYYNFPMLLYLLINKLDITEYKDCTLEDLYNAVRYSFDVDEDIEKNTCKLDRKGRSSIYNDYDEIYNYNNTKTKHWIEFFIWSEHHTYDNLMNEFDEDNDIQKNVFWVAREYGDGYGYDVYYIDPDTKKEILIEVKSGKNNDFFITDNEYKVMKDCHNHNAEYYIYKYTRHHGTDEIKEEYYYYDYNLDLLVDSKGDYFELKRGKFTDDHGYTTYGYGPFRKEMPKTKTLL